MSSEKIKLGLVDDHALMRKGLVNLIEAFGNCTIVFEANNGEFNIALLTIMSGAYTLKLDVEMDGVQYYYEQKLFF